MNYENLIKVPKELLYLTVGICFIVSLVLFNLFKIDNFIVPGFNPGSLIMGLIFVSFGYVTGRLLHLLGFIPKFLINFLFANDKKQFLKNFSEFMQTGWPTLPRVTNDQFLSIITQGDEMKYIEQHNLKEEFIRSQIGNSFTQMMIGVSTVYFFFVSYWFVIPFALLIFFSVLSNMGDRSSLILGIMKNNIRESRDELNKKT